ncbi:unnamed protein product [Miscanthus lutarioriparius]|uniref:KIB1-4 beta-propeller domain-containing protein n=1 Tax=Miscanthus lutarioriparius TaxID=422564 RepID=A0A811N7Z5_9POAL|nr:unnamed protein product [Miscanthus lutarioriparius]
MPWLVAAGHCVGLHDAAIHRVALPEDAHTAACRGSFDNWLALFPVSPPPYQPFLLNPFTMERIHLPVWNVGDGGGRSARSSYHQRPTRRIAPSPLSFVPEFFSDPQLGSVAVCRLRQKESSCPWWCITDTLYLEDIAFFQGKLHAVDGAKHTYEFEDRELEQMRNVHLYCTTLRRSFGINRFPGGAYHTIGFKVTKVSEHSYRRTRTLPPPPVEVKCFDGHALFIGDACCRAFASKDEESNTSVVLGSGSGTSSGAFQVVTLEGMPLRDLQSYDLRTECFRRYQHRPTGPWQCVTVQRLMFTDALPPPPATEWGATLLLWEVLGSLGANRVPTYCGRSGTSSQDDPNTYEYEVILSVHVYYQTWRFTKSGCLIQEAKQEAAREAVSFLRSRYRSVLDDSPWSSIPQYHSYVTEDMYENLEDETTWDSVFSRAEGDQNSGF